MAIIFYARKSVERENSISCETQLEYCRSALTPKDKGEKIITFIDNGFSGGNVNRDGFQKMMKLVRQNKVSKVVVYKLDRISRSLSDFMDILNEFKAHNVDFVSSQEAFSTNSPYGEMIVKILMVFAEFERASTIARVTQAYEHRSSMGFYMGGRNPYGFETVPTIIHGVKTKRLNPIPAEISQLQYIFEVYAQEGVSLRRLMDILIIEGKKPINGSNWTTAKLSTILKNPIYAKADSNIYDYYNSHGVRIVSDLKSFTGEYGAQLYGQTKHKSDNLDWSDMKLVLLSHKGVVDSDIWLKCQKKLEKNKQIGNSLSNRTSWLSGKVVCEKCGYNMTTIKGKINKNGEIRRYFNCTGKSQRKMCSGPKVSIYAEDLEDMVYECISEKLTEFNQKQCSKISSSSEEMNTLKLNILAIEKSEQQLLNTMLSGGFNEDLLLLANQKATQLKQDKEVLFEKMEELKAKDKDTATAVNLARSWENASYSRKKEVALLMIDKILISENGDAKIMWNI